MFAFRDGRFGLYHKAVNGRDQSDFLVPSKEPKFPLDWSADGRYILYRQNNPEARNDLMLLPSAPGAAPAAYLRTAANEEDGRFSPDGRWIAYASDESGAPEVYVQPFIPTGAASRSGPRWQISVRGGRKPVWSGDGKELFYLSADHNLMSVEVKSAAAGVFESGPPKTLFQTRLGANDPSQQYAVSPDGRSIYILQPADDAPTPLTVVLN